MHFIKRHLPYIALVTAAILWGANTPVMKYTLASVPLFTLAFLRFFLGALLLLPFMYKQINYEKKDWFPLFLSAFLGVTVIITLYFLGLRMTSALNSGIIGGTQPIVLLIFGYIFLQEKITRRMMIGSGIALFGLCVVIGKGMFIQGFDISPIGDALIFISHIAFAAYVTLSKELTHKYSALALTFFFFLIGSLFFIPGVIFEYMANPAWISQVPLPAYGGIFYGIVFSAVIAFCLWQYGLAKVSEGQIGFFLYISPVVSSVLAITILGDQLTEEFLIGTLLICIGLIVSQAHLHHKKPLHH